MTVRRSPPPLDLLRHWLARQVDPAAMDWLNAQMAALAEGRGDLALSIALAPRRLGRNDLELDGADRAAASAARSGWMPAEWSVDSAARVMLVLCTGLDGPLLSRRLMELCATADTRELIALYGGLPLYPSPALHVVQAREGLRSSMRAVFEAVAHGSPYPAEQFDEHTWNQMVLKAVFVGSALHPIQGFDRRRNADLARTLLDYVQERWAAGRAVTPELWRAVGPFADEPAITVLLRPLAGPDEFERQAAALALYQCGRAAAHAALETVPGLAADIRSGRLSWETFSLRRRG